MSPREKEHFFSMGDLSPSLSKIHCSLGKLYFSPRIFSYSMGTCLGDAPPSSLMDSIVSPKMKTMEGEGVDARSLAHSTSRVEGRVGTPGWD